MNPLREICSVLQHDDNIFDNLPTNKPQQFIGKMFSKTNKAWMIFDDKNVPEQFLDIPSTDQVCSIFRGRWLVVKHSENCINVAGNTDISIEEKMYIYDISTAKSYPCLCCPEGRYLPLDTNGSNGALDLVTGEVFKSSLLGMYTMIDVEPINQSTHNHSNNTRLGTPVLSSSPGTAGCNPQPTYVYVLRQKNKAGAYSIYTGPQWEKGIKLNLILNISSGRYWHIAWPWIAYTNRIDNLLDAKKNFVVDNNLDVTGIQLTLCDIYFVSLNTVVCVYENNNFQAIIGISL